VDRAKVYIPGKCGLEVVGLHGEGEITQLTHQTGEMVTACCYAADILDPDPSSECIVGRPYREGDAMTMADVMLEHDNVGARARAWAAAGAAEHASVAAFGRLALQLMAHAAPADLIRDVHRAAIDETYHAEACWRLAARLGAGDVHPAAFPFAAPVATDVSLAELAADAVREGCVNETVGAFAARRAAALAEDEQVCEVLELLASDESRHAALSYRIVAWALSVGGEEVRDAVERTLALRTERLNTAELALRAGVSPARLAHVECEGLTKVVRPALGALMAA
jgi:hypothetical protein